MFGIGMSELVVLMAVGLLLFGHQLPRMARSLGSTVAAIRLEAKNLEEGTSLPAQ